MCEFCTKHGEGKKWYQVMEHYSQDLLANPKRQAYIRKFVAGMRQNGGKRMAKLAVIKQKLPLAHRFIRHIGTNLMKKSHFGQVIPLEDALEVVDLVQSITRIACVCRSVTQGRHDARYCLLLGIDPSGLVGDWPELQDNLEVLSKEEARECLKQFDTLGLIHSIWTFETPFIGAICNCDRDCLAYKMQVSGDLMDTMFRAEYIASIDPALCTGCRMCTRQCQFGAVEYSAMDNKCVINRHKCYGCGICRTGCIKNAIELQDTLSPSLILRKGM